MESINNGGAKYECLLFDMDDTLYPLSIGLNVACRLNIQEYMLRILNIEERHVPNMCVDLYKEHGTTMAGLKALGYQFNNDEFHAYVHGKLPYELLKTDPLLKSLLLSIPQRKIVFTNADRVHVDKALKRLGVEDCFDDIICFEALNSFNQTDDYNSSILCKPSLQAFTTAIRIANIDPNRTIFFDDSARNIATAKAAGLHTVIVGSSKLVDGADHVLTSIHSMKEAIPEIWAAEANDENGETAEEKEEDLIIQTAPVQTVIYADLGS